MHYTDDQTLTKIDALFEKQNQEAGFVHLEHIEVRQ